MRSYGHSGGHADVQSSAAPVGILQTLAAAGVVEFAPSVYILFGQNIGTCITAVMASFGISRDAKLATRILPDTDKSEKDSDKGMRLACLTPVTADGGLGLSAIVVDQLRNELHRMLEMARQNVDTSFRAMLDKDVVPLEWVEQREEYIDFLNKEISHYISHLIAIETNERGSKVVSCLFAISGNIERIGDHVLNIAQELTKARTAL